MHEQDVPQRGERHAPGQDQRRILIDICTVSIASILASSLRAAAGEGIEYFP